MNNLILSDYYEEKSLLKKAYRLRHRRISPIVGACVISDTIASNAYVYLCGSYLFKFTAFNIHIKCHCIKYTYYMGSGFIYGYSNHVGLGYFYNSEHKKLNSY